jgi:hypothetical protein
MRVLMTGGGTAGHINPALAIANTIKMNIPDAEIEFVGTERGLENTLVTKEGYKLHHVNIMGISRSLSLKNIKAVILTFTSQIEAKKIIQEYINIHIKKCYYQRIAFHEMHIWIDYGSWSDFVYVYFSNEVAKLEYFGGNLPRE